MLAILICGCGLLGLAIGSFLNVVIYRVPLHESIVTPRSKCPSCGTPILERDNIPVVSWLILRGKCRACRARISARYPLVELLCGALFALSLIHISSLFVVVLPFGCFSIRKSATRIRPID